MLLNDNSLILSIDKNGKITKFNKECEIISGYNKSEVLNKYIFDFLIPNTHLNQWKNLFDYSRKNKVVDDFKLPLLSKKGHEVMICWSNFPMKNAEGDVIDIGFVGSLIEPFQEVEEEPLETPEVEMKGVTIESPIRNKKIVSHDSPEKTIKDLNKINESLDREDAVLEVNLEKIRSSLDEINDEEIKRDVKFRLNRSRGKKKKEEFDEIDNKIRLIEERENILNEREKRLEEEKNMIDDQVNKFKKWREKLEFLEDQIDNKKQGLLEEQTENIDSEEISDRDNEDITTSNELEENQELLENLPDYTAIIQRGILKQVSDSFASLLGYDAEEIKNKSLFDFIIPEGFLGIEKYYLDRLKGLDVSVYETVLLTKDNNKLTVEVSTKPTFFKGIKTEIALFKKL